MTVDHDTIVRLRGQLGLEDEGRGLRGPGARGLEHMARNRRCQRLAAVTLAGASAHAAARRLGVPDRSEDASTFAAGRGEKFETRLFENDCARLWACYERQGLPVAGPGDAKDLEADFDFDVRRRHSEEIILAAASGGRAPSLLLKARLAVRLAGQDFDIEPDALVLCGLTGFYRVAEIKSYADRRGYTDEGKVGSAARQAAVAVVALRQLLAREGLDPAMVSDTADLLFSNSGSDTPTLNRLDVTGEVANIGDTFRAAETTLAGVLQTVGTGSLDNPETLRKLQPNLCGDCSAHCPIFEHCRSDAIAQRHPVILGDGATELLGSIGTLDEVLALRDGAAAPSDADQATVAALLGEATSAWQNSLTAEAPAMAWTRDEGDTDSDDELDDTPLYGADDDNDNGIDQDLEAIQ